MSANVRPSWAEIDLGVIRRNTELLKKEFAPSLLCAVVKADGYGHGCLQVAQAAVTGGAQWLGVALVEEGELLRRGGLDVPILLLSQPPLDAMPIVVENRLTPTIYSVAGVRALSRAVSRKNSYPVHVKIDSGMHRVGADPETAREVMAAISEEPNLHCEALFTHFAVADEPDNPFTHEQVRRFEDVYRELVTEFDESPLVHLSNTAGGILHRDYRRSLVRAGGCIYGIAPSPEVALLEGVVPAMSVHARVSHVKRHRAGEALSYGQRYRLQRDSNIAVIPLGYADGVWRGLGMARQDVLIDGRRFPIAGNVTMDQTIIDCGDHPVEIGDEVVLIGRQGDDEITAGEWAAKLGTIAYEIVCRIGPRLVRRYVDHGGHFEP